MSTPLHNRTTVSRQAAQWIATLQAGGAREHAAFAAWLRESPQHVREYLLMTALEKELADLELQEFDVSNILAEAGKNVVPLATDRMDCAAPSRPETYPDSTHRHSIRRRLRGWTVGIAAALALIAVALWQLPGSQTYATAIGEQRTFELADGSVVELSPASRVRVTMTAELRNVQLLSGEALFKVKHETRRPFHVTSGTTLIEDLGTQFHVYRRSSGTVVAVIEGAVRVASVRLNAGEEARIATDGKTVRRSALDAAQLQSWRQRHLVFSGDTLVDITADFNRYNRTPQLRIEGDSLRERRYSGGFDADDPESLVEYLRQSDAIAVERRGDEIVIRERH